MDRNERISIFNETKRCSDQWKYTNNHGDEVTLYKDDYGMNYKDAKLYDFNTVALIKDIELPSYEKTEIEVLNMDCLYAAQQLVEDGYNPAVLNMASFKCPGGGVTKGSAAQEESLCRRTNLYNSIVRFNNPKLKHRYPLDMNYGAIYSPVVSIFRKSESDGCLFMDAPVTVDVISAAAIKSPALVNGHLDKNAKKILKNKVRTILNLGIYYKNDALVLGAFGCGAYGTPPEDMANIFKDVFSEAAYAHSFKKIVFAIIDDGNAHREHNPEGNFVPFKKVFC